MLWDDEEVPQWGRGLYELVEAEEWDKAAALAGELLAEREDGADKAMLYNYRGVIHVYHGEHDLAIADFNRAEAAAPGVLNTFVCRGLARLNKGDGEYDAAFADFKRVLDVDDEHPGAYCGRGRVYHDKGEHELAIADMNRAIELAPDFAEAYFHRGSIRATTRGEYAPALADFNMALELGPEDATTYIMRGIVLGMLDDYESAAADFARGSQMHPDHPLLNDDMRELVKMHRQKAGGD